MQRVRVKRVDAQIADAGKHPQRAERDRRDREPAPQPRPRECERGGGDHGEVEIERPVIRQLARDQQRRGECADLPECCKRRAMQQRGGKGRQRHNAEQHECGAGHEEFVQRIGHIDCCVSDCGAGGGEDARDMRGRDAREPRELVVAACPFAGRDQGGREQAAEEDAHARPDQPGFDRELH